MITVIQNRGSKSKNLLWILIKVMCTWDDELESTRTWYFRRTRNVIEMVMFFWDSVALNSTNKRFYFHNNLSASLEWKQN